LVCQSFGVRVNFFLHRHVNYRQGFVCFDEIADGIVNTEALDVNTNASAPRSYMSFPPALLRKG
jgi:hypothetical protein